MNINVPNNITSQVAIEGRSCYLNFFWCDCVTDERVIEELTLLKILLLQAASPPSHFIALIIIYYDRNAKIIDQLLSSIIMHCVQCSVLCSCTLCTHVHSVHMYSVYTLYTPPVALPSSQLVLGLGTGNIYHNISQHEGGKLRKSLKSTETSWKIRACSDCDINSEKKWDFYSYFQDYGESWLVSIFSSYSDSKESILSLISRVGK